MDKIVVQKTVTRSKSRW